MHQYHDLVKRVMKEGVEVTDRTGTGTLSVFGHQMRFDLSKGFPAVTTKRLAWKAVVGELLWFLEGSTDERRLAELTYCKDRSELVGKPTIWTANADAQGKSLGYVNDDIRKWLGPVYGYGWTRWEGSSSRPIMVEPREVDKDHIEFQKPSPIQPNNTISDEYIGTIVTSKYDRNARVLDKRTTGRNSEYLIQYDDTGDTSWVSRPNLRARSFGGKLIHGVAICDEKGVYQHHYKERIYNLWYNMIDRCYNKKNAYYEYYGANGVGVCGRWLRFSLFLTDVEAIPNFYKWLKNDDEYNLDKDYYQSKWYSPNTCVFISKRDNILYSNPSISFEKVKRVTFESGHSYDFITNKDLFNKYPDFSFTNEGVRQSINKGRLHRKCKFETIDCDRGAYRLPIITNQIKDIIDSIKSNPDSRRLIVSAWNPNQIHEMALPPCHVMTQFRVINGRLSCQLYQRSADIGLGIPFNIASYALMTHILAKECNLEVGDFVHTIGDAHIYTNHITAMEEVVSRSPYELPTLNIDDGFDIISGLSGKFSLDSAQKFTLDGYKYHPEIKMVMAV